MCGLVGIAGAGIQHADLAVLEDLSHVIALRGVDGAGIVQGKTPYYGKKGVDNLILEKDRWDISYFRQKHSWTKDGNREIFNGIHNNFFCVHVRAATIGEISKENSHPFDVGGYIGMHNGTLKDTQYFKKGTTDSEMMFRDVNERGLKLVLRDLNKDSAYALVLLDKETGQISFARNDKRELYFCFHDTRNVMYWASEQWMLTGIMGRRGQKIKDNQIWYFSPGTIYTIDPAKIARKPEEMELEKIFEKPRVRVPNNSPSQIVSYVQKREEIQQKEKKKKEDKSDKIQSNLVLNKEVGVIPGLYCCGCQKPLSLADQYFASLGTFGKKYSQNTIICDTCDTQAKQIILN